MQDILTVTLNPALDISTSVDAVVPEDKLRCDAPVIETGGGGINVARAIGELGGRAKAFVALSGFHGQEYLHLLKDAPLDPLVFDIPGETRQSLAVTDRRGNTQYRFVMPGPRWTPDQAQAAIEAIGAAIVPGGFVVLSGSQPPGVPQHFPTQLAAEVETRGGRLILDTSGKPLRALLDVGSARQHVLRLDDAEATDLAGRKLSTLREFADFARELVTWGVAEVVVLALGAEGSVLASEAGCWHAKTPEVIVRSKVGAGDSFVGAFTLALTRGADWPGALCYGVAAASAAVMSDASELCRAADVARLHESCTLTAL